VNLITSCVRHPPGLVKCPKCGYENPDGAKFCANCGYRLDRPRADGHEALGLLLVSGGMLLLLTLVFNSILRIVVYAAALYLIAGLLGIYGGYELYRGRVGAAPLAASAASIALGLASTLFTFALGLPLKGIVPPDWIIFLVAAWKLLSERGSFRPPGAAAGNRRPPSRPESDPQSP